MSRFLCALVLTSSTLARASSPSETVVGGTVVPAGKWPDAVAVLAQTAACTGTLIAPDVVLTAGHCIGVHPELVIVNTTDYSKQGGEAIGVTMAVAYPSWEDHYDVGVLVLDHAASTPPRPIASSCTARDLEPGGDVEVVGFGLTTKTGTGSNTRLHQAKLVVTDPTCSSAAGCAPLVAPGGEFAAGGSGTDACFGDSGGPIYLDNALIGVVSRGLDAPGQPCGNGGIYVRADAPKVLAWIKKVTGRTIARATCGAADGTASSGSDGTDSTGADDTSDDTGGCSATATPAGSTTILILVALGLVLHRGRRRHQGA